MTPQRSKHALRVGHEDEFLQDSSARHPEPRPPAATGLLVSVRSVAEARIALEAGVDLLDVKEPNRGPLGRADWQVIADVARCMAGRVPMSAALGELRDGATWAGLPEGVAFAKLGLAGCRQWIHWPQRWAAAMAQWPGEVVRGAVA